MIGREALWQVLRMYDVGGKLLNMYIDNLDCVRVKVGESEWFKIDSRVRQRCITYPWLFNVYIEAVMK